MTARERTPLAGVRALFVAGLLLTVSWVHVCMAGPLTDEAKRGKQIYFKGSSLSGRTITAFVGRESIEAPGASMPCVNCHGSDGLGRAERGINPTNITWEYLTTPYGLRHLSGRTHPGYTEETLAGAIVDGVDPAGNKLDGVMPRYVMSRGDLADLIAYVSRLGTDRDPGLTERSIKVGTILPITGPLAEIGLAMKGVMTAYFTEINTRGGIYNRKIELRVADRDDAPSSAMANAKRLIDEEQVFSLVSAFAAGIDHELAALAEAEGVPNVGPFTLLPQDRILLSRFTFYLFSGLREQVRALVDYSAGTLRLRDPQTAIIYPAGATYEEIAKAVEEQGKKYGWRSWARVAIAEGRFEARPLVIRLHKAGTEVVVFLGSGQQLKSLAEEAEQIGWMPYVLAPGSLITKATFDTLLTLADRFFLAYPLLPPDPTDAGMQELRALRERYQLPAGHLTAQLSAYCAAKVLVEGFKRAGRELNREKLIAALEGLYEFDTGLTPPMTYGPNRRIGAPGAYIVTITHKGFAPVSSWLVPTP